MPMAPLLSQGVGSSIVPLLLLFTWGCVGRSCPKVNSQVGGKCPMLSWPSRGAMCSSGGFWKQNVPALSLTLAL